MNAKYSPRIGRKILLGLSGLVVSLGLMGAGTSASSLAKDPYIMPVFLSETVAPGSTVSMPLSVVHYTPSQDTVELVPAGNALNGGLGFPVTGSVADITPFLPSQDYHLAPTTGNHFALTVHVPTHTASGLYEVGIAVSRAEQSSVSKNDKGHTSLHLHLVARTVILVKITVTGTPVPSAPKLAPPVNTLTPEGMLSQLFLTNPQRSVLTRSVPLTLTIHEGGQVVFTAHDTMQNIQPVSTATSDPIRWTFTVVPGTYTVTVSSPGLASQTVTKVVSPQVAKQAQQAVTSTTHQAPVTSIWQFIPVWVWAIAGVFFLAFIVLLIVIVWMRKKND